MGRHTGFLILAALTGLAIIAIAGRTDQRHIAEPVVSETNEAAISQLLPPASSSPATPDTAVVLKSLRPDSLVIIGSLDTSGAPHQVEISITRSNSVTRPNPGPNLSAPLQLTMVSHSRVSESKYFQEPPPIDLSLAAAEGLRSRRCFRVPRFESTGTRRELCETTLIGQSEHVSVYVEHSSASQFEISGDDIVREICHQLEQRILGVVRGGIGPVADVDGDGTLSIVIADIDRQDSREHPPVRGCVTDQDFLLHDQSDFSGDVIYLDRDLPSGDELASLLAHELTHAAVLSFQLRNSPAAELKTTDASRETIHVARPCVVPAWLNEAAAHWMEHRLTENVPGFSERIAAFRSDPSTSPVVASEDYLTFASRRSGSRAAGYLFLKSLLKSDEQLRDFVLNDLSLEERTERVANVNFRDGFRTWMVDAAALIQPVVLDRSQQRVHVVSYAVHGTAMLCITLPDGAESISISSDSSARLEVISR